MLLLVHDLALVHLEGLLDLDCHVRVPLHHLPFPSLYGEYVVVVDTIVLLRSLLLQLLLDQLDGVRVLPPVVVGRVCTGRGVVIHFLGLQGRCLRSTEKLREQELPLGELQQGVTPLVRSGHHRGESHHVFHFMV